ncbi:act minimal PKS ketosynthase (KS/KS alpha)/minimal PKS ketosynthase (KS/KS alpha) [Thermosporothrix hazakensis]|jgi:beta-ketoacyl-acyl-carrier-protein synthase II|uniref:Act minimal PKS ketosynthase (KS/KS alpha)/minimal PKS ketosynthase (KS/KS alpha) n=2 Tax=Thermosporothrix TaxID=768650 RepID=A0A326UI26_THEHA|nr:beta-ketoacyl-[acyl-carrier-protein] synthase family protein [Thermosporothrix hazakensis]PZW31898.1 act minimal PKS ketosynthase (KS/KS alpha)/minimal PKS ketosynthase (KS/KS alpha) [Thermosporothrix hazakensis]BBH91633.1 putative polyketide beta-ketoacyl synthase 1 [Thermosporothrix sp. COM3]GCE49777.1 putative polyketide beta-ketoacyl synthase 1 [Thermosporothrix hazakensis]
MQRRVVITGLGVVAPSGIGKKEFAEALWQGRSAVSRISCFDPSGHASQIAAECRDFVPERFGITPQMLDQDDRVVHLALVAAREAMQDANFTTLDPSRLGVSIATAVAGTKRMAEHFAVLTEGGTVPVPPAAAHPFLYRAATFNTTSAVVATEFGAESVCSTLATGCTGGNDALGFALDVIRRGEADVMIAGAAEAPITPLVVACFDVIGALSQHNDEPQRASRPFDKDRTGFVLAEGAGLVILEELEHARRRGAHIYCELSGFGSTCNAYHMTDLPAEGDALSRSLTLALADAACTPEQVDYVNAHGSSTRQNSICETYAIKKALGQKAYQTPVSSIKSMIGHALAAANAIEAVACALAFEHHMLPPTINLDEPDPACDLDYIPHVAREWHGNTIASLSSGFGGIHSTIVLQRVGEEENAV